MSKHNFNQYLPSYYKPMTKVQQLLRSKQRNKIGKILKEIHIPYKPGGQKLKLLGI
jgi:hypothetical protein